MPYYNKTESYFYLFESSKNFLHYCHYEIKIFPCTQTVIKHSFVLKDISLDKCRIKRRCQNKNIFADPTKGMRTIICCVVLYFIVLRKYFYPTNLTYIDKIMAMNCCELKVLKLYECQKYIVLKNESLVVVNLLIAYNSLNMILIR